MPPEPIPINRVISRPYGKLKFLCDESRRRAGRLVTFAAVADALNVTPGLVSQMFGFPQEHAGHAVKTETLEKIAAAFGADGVRCDFDWFYLEYEGFAAHVAGSQGGGAPSGDLPSGDWELRETTVLADLVELRLHPPRPGNEAPDSYLVDATLLFGTAVCDYDPEEGEEPRSISIALHNARSAIGSDGYRPLQNSMIGERIQSENFDRVAGGIEIKGPAPSSTLEGNPIGDQHLAVIAGTNAGEDAFAVTVAAHRRSFVVADVDKPYSVCDGDVSSDNKNVILNHFIYRRCGRDEAGRALLAQATMKRPHGEPK